MSPLDEKSSRYSLILILAVAFVAFSPALSGNLLNWDDYGYILSNPLLRNLSPKQIEKIFSSFVMGNYHPLTVLSFALEYAWVGTSPFLFHLNNLLLHLLNTALVFAFVRILIPGNRFAAVITSLLFAFHPMRAESVAWVSGRKDLLYVFFLLLSSISYFFYTERKQKSVLYFLSLLFFLLSLLSKAQGVVLAPLLILYDFHLKRKWELKKVFEKVPFFLLAFTFGLIALKAQKDAATINPIKIEAYQTVFVASYGILNYILRAFFPLKLSALHPYPVNSEGLFPLWFYFSSIPVIALVILSYLLARRSRLMTFGLLFFVISLIPVLQFLPVGRAAFSERYTYLPFLGLFLIMGYAISLIPDLKLSPRNVAIARSTFILFLVWFVMLSYQRSKVWNDNLTLWNDAIEKYPNSVIALQNRGVEYAMMGKQGLARADLSLAYSLAPNDIEVNRNLAQLYRDIGRMDQAIEHYNRCILINPKDFRSYVDRGLLLALHRSDHSSALIDFETALRLEPTRSKDILEKMKSLNQTSALSVANENWKIN